MEQYKQTQQMTTDSTRSSEPDVESQKKVRAVPIKPSVCRFANQPEGRGSREETKDYFWTKGRWHFA